jgi:hypothetical protein
MVLVIRHPFMPKAKLLKMYFVFTTLVVIQAVVVILCKAEDTGYEKYKNNIKEDFFMLVVYFVTAFFGIIYTTYRLFNSSIDSKARNLILRRYMSFILYFFIENAYNFMGCSVHMFVPNKEIGTDFYNTTLTKALKFITYTQGIFVPILMLNEPELPFQIH